VKPSTSVRDGLETIAAVDYAVEPKFDGLAISLTYENGRGSPVVRGDGRPARR
jgi:DNA ligase (NAD+)